MLTGSEGTGKSHFLRQIAVCLAAGINPVGFARIDLLRILLIDCENGARHTRRQLRPLRDIANAAGRPIPVGSLRILMRPSGLDLTGEDDSAWLLERVIAHKPDVLIIGPLYRLHAQNPNEEMPARQTIAALDAARIAASCAVILEAHAGHAQNGKPRDLRPTGSSLWLRWPEFGYGLAATEVDDKDRATKVDLKAWRGPRDEREWPRAFTRGKPSEWPWLSTSRPQPTPLPLPAPAAQRSFSEPLERDQAF
jgi:RecA-family ATPase